MSRKIVFSLFDRTNKRILRLLKYAQTQQQSTDMFLPTIGYSIQLVTHEPFSLSLTHPPDVACILLYLTLLPKTLSPSSKICSDRSPEGLSFPNLSAHNGVVPKQRGEQPRPTFSANQLLRVCVSTTCGADCWIHTSWTSSTRSWIRSSWTCKREEACK